MGLTGVNNRVEAVTCEPAIMRLITNGWPASIGLASSFDREVTADLLDQDQDIFWPAALVSIKRN